MLTCKADRADFAGLMAATEKGLSPALQIHPPFYLIPPALAARKFSEFQSLAETQLKELDRGLSDCWRLVGTRAENEKMETLCRRTAELEEKCRDVGDRLRPGEAVHVRDAITRMATKDELVICQQYYDSMGEKLEGALERCLSFFLLFC